MMASSFKSFITEKEVEEVKKKRQEEWERIRKPDQPLERPQEKYDHRTLYDRLKQQKDKKQEEWEDQFKFKNMIYKGLDEEEAGFLNQVVNRQAELQVHNMRREIEEVSEYREAVAKLHEEAEPASTPAGHSTSPTLNSSSSSNNTGNNNGSSGNSNSSSGRRVSTSGSSAKPQKSQLSLIAGSIKTKRRKSSDEGRDHVKRARLSDEGRNQKESGVSGTEKGASEISCSNEERSSRLLGLIGDYSSDSSDTED